MKEEERKRHVTGRYADDTEPANLYRLKVYREKHRKDVTPWHLLSKESRQKWRAKLRKREAKL